MSTTCWCTKFPTRTIFCASTPAIRIRISSTSARTIAAGAQIENAGERYSQLAIQGPKALGILQRFTAVPLESIRYYHFTFGTVDGVDCLIARTGYTGEDGFEIYFAPEHSEKLWTNLLDAGTGRRTAALRPGRAKHAAPGSVHVPLRPRN